MKRKSEKIFFKTNQNNFSKD